MENIKLTEEEISKITNIQKSNNDLTIKLGGLNYHRELIDDDIDNVMDKLKESNKEFSDNLKELENKYGVGSLSLTTFEITKESE